MSPSSIARNWEPPLAAALLALLLLLLGNLAYRMLREPPPAPAMAKAAPQLPALFAEQAFAFLYPPLQLGPEHNAFRFRRSYPKADRPAVDPGRPTVVNPPPPPPKPKPLRRLFFQGWMEAEGQPRAAFLEIADQRSGAKLHAGPVRVGDQVAGFTVLAMDAAAITLRDPAGRAQTVPIRQALTVELP